MIIPHLTQHDSPFLTKTNTGLGNALFQIFAGYGLARKYNKKFNNINLKKQINKLKNKYNLNHGETIYRNLKFYDDTINTIDDITINNKYKPLYKINECSGASSLSNRIINVIKTNNTNTIYISGYLQSHLYFNDYYNDICKLIEPDLNSYNLINDKYPHLFDTNIINISVHVRLNWGCNIKYNEKFTFFFEAINYIKNNISKQIEDNKKIIINIFSDDIKQLKHKFNVIDNDCIYYEDNLDYIDLWCMSLCHHNILSHSTLSWWGAYINNFENKIVLYPKDILRREGAIIHKNPTYLERIYEHYKPEWIGLDTKNVIYQ